MSGTQEKGDTYVSPFLLLVYIYMGSGTEEGASQNFSGLSSLPNRHKEKQAVKRSTIWLNAWGFRNTARRKKMKCLQKCCNV